MSLRRKAALVWALALAALVASGCRGDDRHFVPAPKPEVDDEDEGDDDDDDDDDGTASGDGDGDKPATGDGGPAVAGDGDGDGDGDAPEGELKRSEAKELVTFLDKELPAGIKSDKLFTKLARKCSTVSVCAPPACQTVLANCTGGDITGCGSRLQASCPAFQAFASGASGDALKEKTDVWLRDLWGDLVVKIRLSLPESKQDKVDQLAERHQL